MKKNERGMTLVELLIGMAIAAVVGAGILGVLFTASRIYTTSAERLDAATYSREVSSAIANELRYASKVSVGEAKIQYTVASGTREMWLDTKQHAFIANGAVIAAGQVEKLAFTATADKDKAVITATFTLYGRKENKVTIMTINPTPIE
jgi:prepilin-type N-terminal cleavage/methylation domain-containing protein